MVLISLMCREGEEEIKVNSSDNEGSKKVYYTGELLEFTLDKAVYKY